MSHFCDDTRVMRAVEKESDVEHLLEDRDRIYKWQVQNNILFNGKKFELLRYGPNSELKESTNYLTPGCEEFIEVKETLRDLGVIMSDKATFEEPISHVCKNLSKSVVVF